MIIGSARSDLELTLPAPVIARSRAHPGSAPGGLPLPRSERGRGSGRGGTRICGEPLAEPKVLPLPGPLLPRREERELIVRDPEAVAGCAHESAATSVCLAAFGCLGPHCQHEPASHDSSWGCGPRADATREVARIYFPQ